MIWVISWATVQFPSRCRIHQSRKWNPLINVREQRGPECVPWCGCFCWLCNNNASARKSPVKGATSNLNRMAYLVLMVAMVASWSRPWRPSSHQTAHGRVFGAHGRVMLTSLVLMVGFLALIVASFALMVACWSRPCRSSSRPWRSRSSSRSWRS